MIVIILLMVGLILSYAVSIGYLGITAMTVPIIIILSMGPIDPIEIGINRGDGFIFSTLIDDNRDGRIELLLPFNSTVALGINQTSAGNGDYLLWDIQGSQIYNNILPFEIPIFADTEGGSLGIDYGTLLSPPIPFEPGNTFSVAQGGLSLWPELRFIDTTGVGDLRDFVAGRSTLPNFNGPVVVSDLRIQFVPEPGAMTLSLTCLLAVATRRSPSGRHFHKVVFGKGWTPI